MMAFQIVVAIFKANSINSSYFIFYFMSRASRICSRVLLIFCVTIEVFPTRIFLKLKTSGLRIRIITAGQFDFQLLRSQQDIIIMKLVWVVKDHWLSMV